MRLFESVINEDSDLPNTNERLYPVYITLFSNDTKFGKLIRKFTGSEYSHATVALDATMNNMYSFSDVPYNEARFFCAGFVRESIWSPEYTLNRHFRVLVTFVNKEGRDNIQKKIDYFVKNFDKFDYNDIGLVQYYFNFKNTKKHDETKKMKWFCSEFVTKMINSSEQIVGFEDVLQSPEDLLNMPNVIDLGKYTIPEFKEEILLSKTKEAEKEFRRANSLPPSTIEESAFSRVSLSLLCRLTRTLLGELSKLQALKEKRKKKSLLSLMREKYKNIPTIWIGKSYMKSLWKSFLKPIQKQDSIFLKSLYVNSQFLLKQL